MGKSIRIVSGLVLFAFVAMHLLNVAFGLRSIEAMDAARPYFMGVWTNPVGSFALVAAFVAHMILGLVAIYRRNTLRVSTTDAVQMCASLAIVPLLTPHVVGTGIAAEFGVEPSFDSLIPYFWIWAPEEGLRQVLLLTVLWVHGCIGVFTWMRIQRWWGSVAGFLHPLAVAIPVLALLGFVEAGNEAIEAIENPPAIEAVETAPADADEAAPVEEQPAESVPDADERSLEEVLAILSRINWTVFYAYIACVAAVLLARQVRLAGERKTVRVAFVEGPQVTARVGLSVLELADIQHVPVARLCRGRGRCGTCRVRIASGDAQLPEPGEDELRTLARVGAAPGERLACQLRPGAGNLEVERVLAPYVRPRDLHWLDVAEPRQPEKGAA